MKLFYLIALLSSFCLSYSQEVIINDSLSITMKKARPVKNSFLFSATKLRNENMIKVFVSCNIDALYDQEIDINPFSLVDKENKIRYRIAEYLGYKRGISYRNAGLPYLKSKIVNKKGNPFHELPLYDPTIKDSFYDFHFDGYTNVEIPTNYGTFKNIERISVIYFSPSKINHIMADLFFGVFINNKKPILELYYGNIKIGDVEIE